MICLRVRRDVADQLSSTFTVLRRLTLLCLLGVLRNMSQQIQTEVGTHTSTACCVRLQRKRAYNEREIQRRATSKVAIILLTGCFCFLVPLCPVNIQTCMCTFPDRVHTDSLVTAPKSIICFRVSGIVFTNVFTNGPVEQSSTDPSVNGSPSQQWRLMMLSCCCEV